jgi:hypothetical protein
LGNEACGHKGKGTKYEIEKFILAGSMHHPSRRVPSLRRISGDPEKMTTLTLRTWNRKTWICYWGGDEDLYKVSVKMEDTISREYEPAVDALVNATVWNHIGKKYMIVKVQLATKKLLKPLRTGNFCFRRNGANTGSLATQSSITTKAKRDITESTSGQRTAGAPHCRDPGSV